MMVKNHIYSGILQPFQALFLAHSLASTPQNSRIQAYEAMHSTPWVELSLPVDERFNKPVSKLKEVSTFKRNNNGHGTYRDTDGVDTKFLHPGDISLGKPGPPMGYISGVFKYLTT
jgi:hypothetical protein